MLLGFNFRYENHTKRKPSHCTNPQFKILYSSFKLLKNHPTLPKKRKKEKKTGEKNNELQRLVFFIYNQSAVNRKRFSG